MNTIGFRIGDRALFNDGQQVTIESVYNGGGAHGCYGIVSDTGARFTAHGPELGAIEHPPKAPRSLAPGECRTIVRYDAPRARQTTPAQQPQSCAAASRATLYGIAAFADGYAVFWAGRYDDARYPTREAAIRELAKRDADEKRQPTPAQQPQARAKVPPCTCGRLAFPHRRDSNCIVHEWDRQAERELRGVTRIGSAANRGEAHAINALYRGLDNFWRGQ